MHASLTVCTSRAPTRTTPGAAVPHNRAAHLLRQLSQRRGRQEAGLNLCLKLRLQLGLHLQLLCLGVILVGLGGGHLRLLLSVDLRGSKASAADQLGQPESSRRSVWDLNLGLRMGCGGVRQLLSSVDQLTLGPGMVVRLVLELLRLAAARRPCSWQQTRSCQSALPEPFRTVSTHLQVPLTCSHAVPVEGMVSSRTAWALAC